VKAHLGIAHEVGRVWVGILDEKILWDREHRRTVPPNVLCQSPHCPATLHDQSHADAKVGLIEVIVVLSEDKVGRNIALECAYGCAEVDWSPSACVLGYTSTKLVELAVDQVLAAQNVGFGKVGIQRQSSGLVLVVIGREDDAAGGVLSIDGPVVFVPPALMAVELLKIRRVVDVQFVGTDADDRTFVANTVTISSQVGACQA